MRRGMTLIEIILVLVVLAILSAGSFKAIDAIYTRSAQAKALTELSLQSQIVLDQVSMLLYNRIPNSVIGYTPGGVCEPISDLSTARPILEWIGTADDELLRGEYDGFVDMNASDKSTFTLSTPNSTDIVASYPAEDFNLIFAGAFDGGSEDIDACSGAFGWHGNDSNLSYDITTGVNTITTVDTVKQPDFIYEKYYIAKSGFAIARREGLNIAGCASLTPPVSDDTLLLFYDFQPYSGETFCADNQGVPNGQVAILAQDVVGFSAQKTNEVIRLSIDMQRTVRGRTCNVHVSKQKAVF